MDPNASDPLGSLTAVATDASQGASTAPVSAGEDAATLVPLALSEADLGAWRGRVDRARQRVKQVEQGWDVLMEAYLPKVKPGTQSLRVQTHFRNVHTKIGQLFYRTPEVQLTPSPGALKTTIPDPANPQNQLRQEDIVSIKQAVLNQHLGRKGINSVRLIDQQLFDVLAWSGISPCKVGYRVVMKPTQQPVMGPPQPHPLAGLTVPPGSMLPPAPMMDPMTRQPMMQTVRVPIFEEWYAKHFSPKKLLFNDDLKSTRYDQDATWIGMEFFMSKEQAMREYGLTDDDLIKAGEDDRVYKHEADNSVRSSAQGLVHGVEIFYKASVFSDEIHPQAIRQLTLLDGLKDRAVVHRASVDQSFNPDGSLTEDSLLGFPIKVLAIRDLTDSPYPPSDSAFTDAQVKELNTFRRQEIKLRDAAIGKMLVDEGAFDETMLSQLKDGDVGEHIRVQEGRLSGGKDRIMASTAQVMQTADSYRTEASLKHDIDETLGIGSTQAGTPETTVRSATEIASVQTAVAGRMEKEQARVIDHYLSIVEALDSLLMRYATNTEYVKLVGQDGSAKMAAWNNQVISGRYLYDIVPDSSQRVDLARDRQQTMAWYNLIKGDPLANRVPVIRELARQFGEDVSSALLPPQPPQPPPPDKPKISFSFSAIDLQDPLVRAILIKAEMMPDIPPPPMQPPHPGGVNVHQAEQSGARPNAPGSHGDNRTTRLVPTMHEAPPAPPIPHLGQIPGHGGVQ